MKKKRICGVLLFLLLLSSCNRYFRIEFNQYSRVYLPGLTNIGVSDSFDLYRSEANQVFKIGNRTYFFDSFQYDYNGKLSPSLAYLEKSGTKVQYVCQNPNCVHNMPVDFSERCILCDISDYRYVVCQDGMLYFARAKRENSQGGFYYNQTDGTDHSEASEGIFIGQHDFVSNTEVEVPWEIIAYDLESGEYEVLYSVPAESYLDSVVYVNGFLYFVETYYAERENLILEREDGEWYYFYDIDTDCGDIKRRKRHFYTELTLREEVMHYYQSKEDYNVNEESSSFWRHLINLRYNRKYKLGEEKQLFEKTYALKSLDLETRQVTTPIAELPSEPQELLAYDNRIYLADKLGIYSISADGEEWFLVCEYGEYGMEYSNISSLQYDEYTNRLYFLDDGVIRGLKLYEDRTTLTKISHFEGTVGAYQLTADGVYATTKDGSLHYIRWSDIYTPYFKTVYQGGEEDLPIQYATVIGEYVYVCFKPAEEYEYYEYYRLKLEVTVTDYVSVEDYDTPGAGIREYELNVIWQKLENTRYSAS